MVQKSVLGKGLASLLPGAAASPPPAASPTEAAQVASTQGAGAIAAGPAMPAPQSEVSRDRHMGISMIPLSEIQVNPYQPRREFDEAALKELSDSIRTNGLIQPLVVRKTPLGYQLIAGERRLRAAKMAELKQVPIVIRRSTDREALEIALVENIQRQDLNCIDEALAYFQLMQEFALTQEEVATKVGKERATVANSLRLLRLPEPIIEDLKNQLLSPGHGKALLALEDHEQKLKVRGQILEKNLSVRQTEALIQEIKAMNSSNPEGASAEAQGATSHSPVASRLATLSQDLTRHWATRVEFKGNDKRGKIVIHYGSRDELERLLSLMQNSQKA